MPPSPVIIPAVAAVALARLLWAERSHSRLAIYVFKPLTSCCFIAFALSLGAWHTPYGRTLVVAQALCWLGDVLLMLPGSAPFMAGLGAFLAGHAGYAAALAERVSEPWSWPTGAFAITILLASHSIYRWLAPNVPQAMLWPVRAYVLMITVMTITAAAQTTWLTGPWYAVVGALLFYLSDICVARERFVTPSLANTYVGLPLYYAGQMLLAASVSAAL